MVLVEAVEGGTNSFLQAVQSAGETDVSVDGVLKTALDQGRHGGHT